MTPRNFWRRVLIVVLSVVLAKPGEASGYPSGGAIVAAVAGFVAAVVIVPVVIVHKSFSKRTITGCVNSGERGITVIDDNDQRSCVLSGNTTGIKLGDRMTLQGKKIQTKDAGKTLVWETRQITKGFRRLSGPD